MIRGYLRQNTEEQPTAFPDNFFDYLPIAKALAQGYWDHRTTKEIKRDANAGVNESDYIEWVLDELAAIKKLIAYN